MLISDQRQRTFHKHQLSIAANLPETIRRANIQPAEFPPVCSNNHLGRDPADNICVFSVIFEANHRTIERHALWMHFVFV